MRIVPILLKSAAPVDFVAFAGLKPLLVVEREVVEVDANERKVELILVESKLQVRFIARRYRSRPARLDEASFVTRVGVDWVDQQRLQDGIGDIVLTSSLIHVARKQQ